MLECMGSPTVVVVAKTSLQPRSWLESVALRSVEAQDWDRHARWKRTAYSPSSLEVDVLDGEVIIRRSRAIIHHFVPCPSSPFVEHYVAPSCAHAVSLGQECGMPSSPPRSR
jgi:hypothetical protein